MLLPLFSSKHTNYSLASRCGYRQQNRNSDGNECGLWAQRHPLQMLTSLNYIGANGGMISPSWGCQERNAHLWKERHKNTTDTFPIWAFPSNVDTCRMESIAEPKGIMGVPAMNRGFSYRNGTLDMQTSHVCFVQHHYLCRFKITLQSFFWPMYRQICLVYRFVCSSLRTFLSLRFVYYKMLPISLKVFFCITIYRRRVCSFY